MERVSWWAGVLASGLLVACAGEGVDLDSGGQEGTGEGGNDGGTVGDDAGGGTYGEDTGGGTDGGGEPEDFSCDSVHRTPTDANVLFDADVSCTHTMFARYGVAAVTAAATDAVYLATAGFEESWVFRIDASVVEPMSDSPRFTQQRTLLALDAEETLIYAGVVDDDTLAVSRFTDRWELQNIEIPGGTARLVDLAAGSDGSASLWLQSLEDAWSVVRWTDPTWLVADATVPDGAPAPRFTIASDGREVALAHVPTDEPGMWQLSARIGSDDALALGDVSDASPSACVPVHTSAAEALAPADAPFVGVSARADALVLDSPSSLDASMAIPDTFSAVSSCPVSEDGLECLPQCHDVASGRLDDTFAAARGDDGTVWVGWVHAEIDRALTYVESCDGQGSCWCDEVIADDLSAYSLRIVAVYGDGTIAPALDMPLAADPCGDQFLAPGDALDLHAHGSRLAIAIRTSESDVLPGPPGFTLRTLLLDTTAFAAPPAPEEPGNGD